MTGRELPPSSPFAGDDGRVDPAVDAALSAFAVGAPLAGVVAALAGTRVLVPVLAELESAEDVQVGGHTHTVEKEASAGIVALRAPDGRTALPVFSSVAAMTAWRPEARPVPSDVARAALSAVTEGWELLVLDPGGPVTALLPRPAVWALAQQQDWRPAVRAADGTSDVRDGVVDDEVRAAVRAAVHGALDDLREVTTTAVVQEPEPGSGAARPRRPWLRRRAASGTATTGSPGVPVDVRAAAAPDGAAADGAAPDGAAAGRVLREVDAVPGRRAEVAVVLTLAPGLDRAALDEVLRRVGEALGADETVTRRVDSLEVRVR